MATTNIDVNKQNVVDLLRSGSEQIFLIPEYQRPYAWSDDEVTTLFDDLWNFTIERSQPNGPKTYFLGSIVSFENEQGEREIIDGQQRITSLFLLLRAIFSKLEAAEIETDEIKNFKSLITPALWKIDEITGAVNRKQTLLRSDVATDHGNEILRNILEIGETAKDAKDNYSRNFNKFVELYEAKSISDPMLIYHFINALLKYCILLPISADSQDTALTIFTTLNNRGLPLSDADIFKSLLYKQLDAVSKKEFAQKWKELESEASEHKESLQSLFYYRMFNMRAVDGDINSSILGARKYFTEKDKNRLKVEIVDKLIEDLKFWKVVNSHEELENEPWSNNIAILQALHILSNYTNEYWKYPSLIFYNTHKSNPEFEKLFLKFLHKLIVLLVTRYLEVSTINAVKNDIFKLNVAIVKSPEPDFFAGFRVDLPQDGPNPYFVTPNRNMVRMLLMMLAYNTPEQKDLLPEKWEIEHIFPQKWDSSYFTFNPEDANAKLEHLGNKLPLEKPKNIKASNNYYDKKKLQYLQSSIALTKVFGEQDRNTWLLDDIESRDAEISDELTSIINKWLKEYEPELTTMSKPQPTPEQEEMIRQLKAAGLI